VDAPATRLSFYLPNFTLAEINGGNGKFAIKFGILVAYLPIDENTTCAKRVSYRNILPLPWLDSLFRNVDYKLAHEDIVVVETLASQSMPKISEEPHVAADALALAYRKLRQKYLAIKRLRNNSDMHEHLARPSASLVNLVLS